MDIEQVISSSEILTANDLQIDVRLRSVTRAGRVIEFHKKEFELLEFLMRNKEKIVTKDEILKSVWGYDFNPQTNIVDVLICRLRAKLDKGFSEPLIRTIRGIGYAIAR